MSARPPSLGWARASLGGALAAVLLLTATPANAAPYNPASLVERTCRAAPPGRTPADRPRFATLLLADMGVILDAGGDPVEWVRHTFETSPRAMTGEQRKVFEAIELVQQILRNQSPGEAARLGLDASRKGGLEFWLFDDDVTLLCIKRAPPARASDPNRNTTPGLLNGNPVLRLRNVPDQLNLTGEKRLTAGAAQLSYRRERVVLPNGSTRHDNAVAIEAALGLVLDESETRSAYLYAGYQLQRVRTAPPPVLPAGTSQRDKDTDVVELGVNGFLLVPNNIHSTFNVTVAGSTAVIFDRVDDSSRLRVDLSVTPGFDPTSTNLGICGLGYFRGVGLGLGGRCSLTGRLQINHFFDRGTGTPGAHDEFVLAGGEIGIEFAPMRAGRLIESGVIAGASYRYEASIHGDVPAIDRFSAFLKYRHWFGDEKRFGMDFGFNFVDGTNPQSFADEHRISFGLGFIF